MKRFSTLRRATLGRLATFAVLAMIPHTLPSETVQKACEPFDVGPPGCVSVQAWNTIIDQDALTIYTLPARADFTDDNGDPWLARFTPYCIKNVFNGEIVDDAICQGAQLVCAHLGSSADMGLWMLLTPFFEGAGSKIVGPVCFSGSTATSLVPQIQALLEEQIGADPPPILLQPTNAIINLPMIASTDIREPIVLPIDDPISGVAEATPDFYWTFADGAAAHGPGLPYDGTSPTANPGYYVTYTYGALGTPTVALTVTWRLTFTIPGNPPVALDDVVREAAASTTVRQAGSELIVG